MREILFRGKRRSNGEWVYGDLSTFYNCFISTYVDKPQEPVQNEDGLWENLDPISTKSVYPITKETIGQYTGLKDKNGTKIFEGDACTLSIMGEDIYTNKPIKDFKGTITYYESKLKWVFETTTKGTPIAIAMDELVNHENLREFEVIGNIHEVES
jgi:uncharacterized phage protein (TIGR01671 family)